jgi:DNA-binding response OmpR family regulator
VSGFPPAALPVRGRRVLLIEDDADIAEVIAHQLEKVGLQVESARSGEAGLEAARRGTDLVLLDLNLPGMDGLEVCRKLRGEAATAHVPVVIVSARADEVDRVLGLEMGADDYVVKPFGLKELVARCRAALRRAERPESPRMYVDRDLEIEFDAYAVRCRDRQLPLTHKEFDLLACLVERAGKVVTRERILERVWGHDAELDLRGIDAHVRRLRQKLGPVRDRIETVVGLGYRFSRE